jgi:hypothetical protein
MSQSSHTDDTQIKRGLKMKTQNPQLEEEKGGSQEQ